MIIDDYRTVKRCEKITVAIKCDICNKIIADSNTGGNWYFSVMTGHHEWGNDSIDSIENKEFCSKECLQKAFNKYINEDIEYYDTAYFEIEREFKRIEKVEVEE